MTNVEYIKLDYHITLKRRTRPGHLHPYYRRVYTCIHVVNYTAKSYVDDNIGNTRVP